MAVTCLTVAAAMMTAAMIDPGFSNFWDASTLSSSSHGPAGSSDHQPTLLLRQAPVDFAQAREEEQGEDGQQVLTMENAIEPRYQSPGAVFPNPAGWFEYWKAGVGTGFEYTELAGSTVWRFFTDPYFRIQDVGDTYVSHGGRTFLTFNNMSGGLIPIELFGFGDTNAGGNTRSAEAAVGDGDEAEAVANAAWDGSQPNRMAEERAPQHSPSAPRPPRPTHLRMSPVQVQHVLVVFLILTAFVFGVLGAARRGGYRLALAPANSRAVLPPQNLLF